MTPEQLITEHMGLAHALAQQVWRTAPHALELDELRAIANLALVATAQRWEPYCVVPETLVLTADLQWVSADSLVVGQELVGFDEYPSAARTDRRFRSSVLTSVGRKVAPCLRVVFEDGRELTCTEDHLLLTTRRYNVEKMKQYRSKHTWYEAADLRPGHRVIAPLRTWARDESFEAGWLAGIIDGEGTFGKDERRTISSGAHGAQYLSISQNPGSVLEEMQRVLAGMGINFTLRLPDRNSRVLRAVIGARRDSIELIGRLRPVRFDARRLWEGASIYSRRSVNSVAIRSIESIGLAEVVVLGTSTKTFLANGLAVHNCAEKGHDPSRLEFFKPFLVRRCYGALIDASRQADWATRSLRTRAKQIYEATEGARNLTYEEIAERSGLTVKEVRTTRLGMSQRPVSFEAEEVEPAGGSDVESSLGAKNILSATVEAIRTLPLEQQAVIAMRYHQGLQLQEVAARLGVTESRASTLHTEAIIAVHDFMRLIAHPETKPQAPPTDEEGRPVLTAQEKALGREFKKVQEQALARAHEEDPATYTVLPVLAVLRHGCPARRGVSTGIELRDRYVYSPPDEAREIPAGKFAFTYRRGRCRFCGQTARATEGRLILGFPQQRKPDSGDEDG